MSSRAARRNASGLALSDGATATPVETPIEISLPSIRNGAWSARRTWAAIAWLTWAESRWCASSPAVPAAGSMSARSTRNSSAEPRDSRPAAAPEHRVAGAVSDRVVHQPEVVDVDVDDGDRGAGAGGSCKGHLQVLHQHRPVREAGHLVVVGDVGQPLLGPAALADVDERAKDVAGARVRKWRSRDEDVARAAAPAAKLGLAGRTVLGALDPLEGPSGEERAVGHVAQVVISVELEEGPHGGVHEDGLAGGVHLPQADRARRQRLEPFLGRAGRLLGVRALDELGDLASDRLHELEQRAVGPAHLTAEELHDAQNA